MNITLLTTWRTVNSAGGAERVFCCFANAMVSRGHSVTAICFDYEKGRPFYPLDSRVTFINAGQEKKPPFFLSAPVIKFRALSFNAEKRRNQGRRIAKPSRFKIS